DLGSVRVALGVTFALGLAAPVLAQAPQPPTREDLSLGQDQPRERASRLAVEGDVERGPCPFADPSFADTRISFSGVEFVNLPGVPAAALDDSWQSYAGAQQQPISVLCEVRDRAAST